MDNGQDKVDHVLDLNSMKSRERLDFGPVSQRI